MCLMLSKKIRLSLYNGDIANELFHLDKFIPAERKPPEQMSAAAVRAVTGRRGINREPIPLLPQRFSLCRGSFGKLPSDDPVQVHNETPRWPARKTGGAAPELKAVETPGICP